MSDDLATLVAGARRAARTMASLDASARETALVGLVDHLESSRAVIEAANKMDKEAAAKASLAAPLLKRLDVEGAKFDGMLRKVDEVRALADPVGVVQRATELDAGLELYRVSCPIGVLCVIFESRPEAAVQISALALKSANAVILKGGKEAAHTNAALVAAMQGALSAGGVIPPEAISLVASRDEVAALLCLHGEIDLIVPRGSNALVSSIMANTSIPVLGHADGVCAVYLDRAANVETAVAVAVDAKTDYPVACNAAETILVHRDALATAWPAVAAALLAKGVVILADDETRSAAGALGAVVGGGAGGGAIVAAAAADFRTEFGALRVAAKAVGSVDEAVDHINGHGSHHTDAIVTEDDAAADAFVRRVDSAGVYVNASTRFADGNRYGFGAEVGVSTNRVHSRGPMGVEGLLIFKYLLYGGGHTAAQFSSGERAFTHRPLPLRLPAGRGAAGAAARAWRRWLGGRRAAELVVAAAVGVGIGWIVARGRR